MYLLKIWRCVRLITQIVKFNLNLQNIKANKAIEAYRFIQNMRSIRFLLQITRSILTTLSFYPGEISNTFRSSIEYFHIKFYCCSSSISAAFCVSLSYISSILYSLYAEHAEA